MISGPTQAIPHADEQTRHSQQDHQEVGQAHELEHRSVHCLDKRDVGIDQRIQRPIDEAKGDACRLPSVPQREYRGELSPALAGLRQGQGRAVAVWG